MSTEDGQGGGSPDVGRSDQALSADNCTTETFAGHNYRFCAEFKSWDDARQSCLDQGMDLVQISDVDENAFVRAGLPLDGWTGATDSASDGAWKWISSGDAFWQGGTFGRAVSGAYENWDHPLLQPNGGLFENCGIISVISGLWFDEECWDLRPFVCEEDRCQDDPAKVAPGQCGCGAADVDSDGDGAADCVDECPSDPAHVTPGQCGCLGEDNLAPAGTACTDGYCSANDECDGAGSCGSLSECAPGSANCTTAVHEGHAYAFCKQDKNFANARAQCQSVLDTDLVHISSAEEDNFVDDHLVAPAWIGASDAGTEGKWLWVNDGSQFWQGGAFGSAVGGAYRNWYSLQPDNLLNQDCAIHKRHANAWRDESCGLGFDFVCESLDLCPTDPNKLEPGLCGCGISDRDADGDGTPDCDDDCPFDATQTAEGPLGCGTVRPSCTGELGDLTPVFECILERTTGEKLAVFGVKNSSSCVIEAPLSADNEFTPAPANRGQSTSYLPGYTRALTTPIEDHLTWKLGNRSATADVNGERCQHIKEMLDSPVILTGTFDHEDPTNTALGEQEMTQGQTFTLPDKLPVVVGNAANADATLSYIDETGTTVTCTYRGGASTSTPNSDLERARGRSFHFVSCDNGATPGMELWGLWWAINVLGGDPRIGQTVVRSHLGEGCSGTLEPPISPEETVQLRQGFDWRTTTELPETDSTGLSALRYVLIYVESREQVDVLERMGILYRHLPFFSSELQRYQGKCGSVDTSGDMQGVFVHALVPAAIYNVWRQTALSVIDNNAGEIPFRAVVLRDVPEPALANSDGTVSWRKLKEAGFDYRSQREAAQAWSLGIPFIDNAIEVVGDLLISRVSPGLALVVQIGEVLFETDISVVPSADDIAEFIADIGEGILDGVTIAIGAIEEFATGSQTIRLDYEVLNRDPLFNRHDHMQRAWGPDAGSELSLGGTKVEILQTLLPGIQGTHWGKMNAKGRTKIKIARGSDIDGICIHLENDAAMISKGITEDLLCNFASYWSTMTSPDALGLDVGQDGRFVARLSTPEVNYLAQIKDGYDYARRVMNLEPKQAEVAVGEVADTIGAFQGKPRAFVGCFDYTEMSDQLLASEQFLGSLISGLGSKISPAAGGAIGVIGMFSHAYVAKDIFVPYSDSTSLSRNTLSHEYGHFVMCDIASDYQDSLVKLYRQRVQDEGLGEDLSDKTGLMMESFADLFGSQISGSTNYFDTQSSTRSSAIPGAYCSGQFCLDYNYRRNSSDPEGGADDPYDKEIRRLTSLFYDAVDRKGTKWNQKDIPTNADLWTWVSSGGYFRSDAGASPFLNSSDEKVAMSGPGIRDWIERTTVDMQDITMANMKRSLAGRLEDDGYPWCDVCTLFALHDSDLNGGSTTQDMWQACRDDQVEPFLTEPPDADLRLNAEDCTACPPQHFSNDSGVCEECDLRHVVVGNVCEKCDPGHVAVGDTCVACEQDEKVVGNECKSCPYGYIADRSTDPETCVECPSDVVLDVDADFIQQSICGKYYYDVGSISGVGDICPDAFWVEVRNLAALGDGGANPASFIVRAWGYGPNTSGACDTSAGLLDGRWKYILLSGHSTGYDFQATSYGADCTNTVCPGDCEFVFGYDTASRLVDLDQYDNATLDYVRLGIVPTQSSPYVNLLLDATLGTCPVPF